MRCALRMAYMRRLTVNKAVELSILIVVISSNKRLLSVPCGGVGPREHGS